MTHWTRPLDRDSPAPLWSQISEQLREAIENGTFGPGDTLPSEAELNRHFDVSRATSRSALNDLEISGLIVRRSGKGSIVLRKRVDRAAEEMAGFSEDMRQRGLTPSYAVLEIGHVKAKTEVAEALELKQGAEVYYSYRLLMADGQPIGLAQSWLAPRLFRHTSPPNEAELTQGSLYAWLHTRCDVTIKKAREYIEAASTRPDQAEKLGVRSGAPLLVARRQSFDGQGKPIEYVILSFRADQYRFHIEVTK
ncbi:GntR family transcriptional regulator [uncultured Limimaricola sp.]|uniref:GntR family transcriptional regulator n=1 Tax=uncultured Limimaricola sp. TaxID=2211667 RepID=UPI0030FBD9E4